MKPADSVLPTPYWWDAAPVSTLPRVDLPRQVDVVVIGEGYTGLSAAIRLAQAGRSVIVLDRQRSGEGASTRNGGITSGNIRPSYSELVSTFGEARARGIVAEGKLAREDLRRFIEAEKIDCDYRLTGRFRGAMTRDEYESGARQADELAKTLGIESYAVPQSEQHQYIGTTFYRGGDVRMDIGGLHPGKLHAGMLRVAIAAGVAIHDGTSMTAMTRSKAGFTIKTDRGDVLADKLLMCTNGYTDGADPWLRRRIVPVRSRIIATESIPQELMDTLMPQRMMCGDNRALSYYYRPSPDGTRILFGGRDGANSEDVIAPTEHLRTELARIFPQLRDVRLTNSWFGFVAMHRDMIPRIFDHDGVLYATGCCGSGVVWARWLGTKVAERLLGASDSERSAFDFRPPKFVPLFRGNAWFMPVVFAALKRRDQKTMAGRD